MVKELFIKMMDKSKKGPGKMENSHGSGIEWQLDGSKFEGDFKNGLKDGLGTLTKGSHVTKESLEEWLLSCEEKALKNLC